MPHCTVAHVDVGLVAVEFLRATLEHVIKVHGPVLCAARCVRIRVVRGLEVRTLRVPPKVAVHSGLREHLLEAGLLVSRGAELSVELREALRELVRVVLHTPGQCPRVLAPHNAHALKDVLRKRFEMHNGQPLFQLDDDAAHAAVRELVQVGRRKHARTRRAVRLRQVQLRLDLHQRLQRVDAARHQVRQHVETLAIHRVAVSRRRLYTPRARRRLVRAVCTGRSCEKKNPK